MKFRVLIVSLALAVTPAFAVNNGPFTIPVISPGANTAIFSVPRMMEWIGKIIANNTKAQKQADKIQLIFDGDSITDIWHNGGKKSGKSGTENSMPSTLAS